MSHISEAPERVRPSGASGVSVTAAKRNVARNKRLTEHCNRRHGRATSRPYQASPEMASGVVAAFSGRGVRERDDAYPHVARVGDVRVIECRDRIQWILQRRRKSGRWLDLGYFRNRDTLIERSRLDAVELRALPPYHVGRQP